MPSQFFGLNIAYTGLLASNAALNTTNNNIANVQTKGYSRQEVNQAAASALRVFQTYGCAGAGVETLSIERIRDSFYDTKYWNNNAKVGEYGMKEYYMKQIETYFDDNGKNAGFKTIFDQLMINGLQALKDNADDATTKTQFIGYAGALAEYFNGVAGNLENVQKDVNAEIKIKVDEINSIAGQIATLNKQINTIELTGVTANELRDRRELLVDQLSEIVDVKITEYPIVDLNNPERVTGANRYIVKIAGGQILVDGNEYNGLECRARELYEKVNQTDADGLYDVYWENGQKFSLYNAAMGGALQGLIQMRDGNNGENFVGQITATGEIKDPQSGAAHDTVTVQVSKAYLQDLNKCNLSDSGGIIDLGNQEFYYDSWSCEISYDDKGKAVYSYTFVLSDKAKNDSRLTNDRVGKVASIGASLSYQGIPYYMKQMNEWVRTFSQKFNDILTRGCDSTNEHGAMLFTANKATDDAQYEFPYGTTSTAGAGPDMQYWGGSRYDTFTYDAYLANGDKPLTITMDQDSYYWMTAMNFDINTAVENDPRRLSNRYDNADGVEQNDLLTDLKKLATDKDKMTFRGSSASEFLQCILADVTLNASRANMFSRSFQDIANTIDNQRISISGVDEDEEAVNLVRYQNGYNLASKMIQTLTEIYDRLILQTGV